MAATIPEVIMEARKLLKDTRSSSYRYDADFLAGVLNSSFREMYRLRPDIFIACCSTTELPKYTADDTTDETVEFPLEEQFFQPCVWFIVGTVELGDDEFTLEGRAQTLLTGFRQALVGAGG